MTEITTVEELDERIRALASHEAILEINARGDIEAGVRWEHITDVLLDTFAGYSDGWASAGDVVGDLADVFADAFAQVATTTEEEGT